MSDHQQIFLAREGVRITMDIDDDTHCDLVAAAVVDVMRALSYSDKNIEESFQIAFYEIQS